MEVLFGDNKQLNFVAYLEDMKILCVPLEQFRENTSFKRLPASHDPVLVRQDKRETCLAVDAKCGDIILYTPQCDEVSLSLKEATELLKGEDPPIVLCFNKRGVHYNAFRR